jgi:hypothetical protein
MSCVTSRARAPTYLFGLSLALRAAALLRAEQAAVERVRHGDVRRLRSAGGPARPLRSAPLRSAALSARAFGLLSPHAVQPFKCAHCVSVGGGGGGARVCVISRAHARTPVMLTMNHRTSMNSTPRWPTPCSCALVAAVAECRPPRRGRHHAAHRAEEVRSSARPVPAQMWASARAEALAHDLAKWRVGASHSLPPVLVIPNG